MSTMETAEQPVTAGGKRHLSTRLAPDIYDEVLAYATRSGVTLSYATALLVQAGLKEQGNR